MFRNMRYLDHLTVLPSEFLSPTLSILFIVLAQKKTNWRYIIIVHSYFGECYHPLFLEFHLHVQLLIWLLTLMPGLHYQIQFKLYLY